MDVLTEWRNKIVGPRPDVPGYADKLTGEDRKILELRPGITGLSREMRSNFHRGPASMKYANEEEILAIQPDPVKYNPGKIAHETAFRGEVI